MRLQDYEVGPAARGSMTSDPRCPQKAIGIGPQATTVPAPGSRHDVNVIPQGGNRVTAYTRNVLDRPQLILHRNATRRRALIRVTTPNGVAFFGPGNLQNSGQNRGFPVFGPVPPVPGVNPGLFGEIMPVLTQDELWAITDTGQVVSVSVLDESSLGE